MPLHHLSVCLESRSLFSTFRESLQDCRRQTLALVEGIKSETLRTQSHPEFSPVGWHLGHIAYTESLWISEQLAKRPQQFGQYERLFAADGLPKSERQNLPDIEELVAYLQAVRSQTLSVLQHDNSENVRLWHWLIQHESQHAEIIAMVLAMHQVNEGSVLSPVAHPVAAVDDDRVYIKSGSATVGSNAPNAIDNERPAHLVSTKSYWIDRAPVTIRQYQAFIEAGGYREAKWWSKEGWQWLQSAQIKTPLYWPNEMLDGTCADDTCWDNRPVCGVSWYEAEAYAKFVGKRLPTEAEWERAMTLNNGAMSNMCDRTSGSVWEWTDTWFAPYPGFDPFPYEGYSQIYFDGEHRVLKGGSFATSKWVRRPSFRNWYHPHRREVFAGFRCAMSS